MIPYMFVINAIPLTDIKPAKIISEAIVHCWVISEGEHEAEELAYAYIRSKHF